MRQLAESHLNDVAAILSSRKHCACEAVVIGASAGGIKVLLKLLSGLPDNFSLPIIIVLHLPEVFESKLAEIFQQHLRLPVQQACDKQIICPGNVYFAPPGYHLSIELERSFSLSCEQPVHFSRPAIDLLMNSAADAYGSSLAGIVLTGASEDGAAGLANIKNAGGLTIVQDPAEAEFTPMPRAAINAQPPDLILSINNMRDVLVQLAASC
jgi:two-component system, chemotaxis family, protein-glutamate methylesterase/glutaminase